jgi:hypothetical protein
MSRRVSLTLQGAADRALDEHASSLRAATISSDWPRTLRAASKTLAPLSEEALLITAYLAYLIVRKLARLQKRIVCCPVSWWVFTARGCGNFSWNQVQAVLHHRNFLLDYARTQTCVKCCERQHLIDSSILQDHSSIQWSVLRARIRLHDCRKPSHNDLATITDNTPDDAFWTSVIKAWFQCTNPDKAIKLILVATFTRSKVLVTAYISQEETPEDFCESVPMKADLKAWNVGIVKVFKHQMKVSNVLISWAWRINCSTPSVSIK